MERIELEKKQNKIQRNYACLVNYELNEHRKKELTDNLVPRRCRFCGNENPKKFKKKAHAISRLIGNKTLKTLYECDDCNSYFSKLEDNFANYMRLYHVLSHVKNGNKLPNYMTTSGSMIKVTENQTDIILTENEKGLTAIQDKEHKKITIQISRSFHAQSVYKAVVKMALSIMPEKEMSYFKETLNWLMNEEQMISSFYLSIRMYESLEDFDGYCVLYKRKDNYLDKVPCYLFGLKYYNFFIQAAVPLCTCDIRKIGKMEMPFLPCCLDEKGFKYNECFSNSISTKTKTKDVVTIVFDVGEWVI